MIQKIEFENFKAFHNRIVIDFKDKKNILIEGDNGAGKSTIFEAFKYIFYYDRLISENIATTSVGSEREADILQFKHNYNHRKYKATDFSLSLNESPIETFDKDNCLVYLISGDNIRSNDKIILSDYYYSVYFNNEEINNICSDIELFQLIVDDVNKALKDNFYESIQLELIQSEHGECRLIDKERDLRENNSLRKFFNEAKLDLINLLLLFSFVDACKKDDGKSRIIVVDDFITSLDATNRILIIKYFIEKFGDCYQKIVLTHNQSFFNLTKYYIENASNQAGDWTYQTLYEFRNEHKIYIYEGSENLDKIKKDYEEEKKKTSPSFESIGNRLRQRFEVLLYEIARFMQIGDLEESKLIISNLIDKNNSNVFLVKDGDRVLNSYNLISDLIRVIKNTNISDKYLRQCLLCKLRKYEDSNELNHLAPIIRDMRIYQKVVLHQLSHGRDEIPTNSPKEIECTMELLRKMEAVVNKRHGTDVNVYTV